MNDARAKILGEKLIERGMEIIKVFVNLNYVYNVYYFVVN